MKAQKIALVYVLFLLAAAGGWVVYSRKRKQAQFAGLVENDKAVSDGKKASQIRYSSFPPKKAHAIGVGLGKKMQNLVTTEAVLDKAFGDMLKLTLPTFLNVYRGASEALYKAEKIDLIAALEMPRFEKSAAAQRLAKVLATVVETRYSGPQTPRPNPLKDLLAATI
jgi:hypothetical protein